MAVINTNITALIGQQNLRRSQSSLQTAMERLSSGLRINGAADDAAGQAIANRMTAQITGLMQAQRNANDGISVAQTTEGALDQINNNLQRIRQLTVQADNGTNSRSDLDSIQSEINKRLEEINRISKQTSFNGVNVLSKDQKLEIQVGAYDDQTITLDLKKINTDTLTLSSFNVSGDTAVTSTDVMSQIGSGAVVSFNNAAGSTVSVTMAADGSFTGTVTSGGGTSAAVTYDNLADVQTAMGASGTSAIAITADLDGDATTSTYNVTSSGAVNNGTSTLYVDNDGSFITSAASTYAAATADPLEALDDAISQVDGLRSNLGAMQNRFDSAIQNLGTTTTNLKAARSRIQDADYAVEVSNMTRAKILQQAGTSVLAQANQLPTTVLQLLRG
ncbi:MAG TPA: FliC/FljB family flagellin [Oleiagrimonas sp.]|nr:FliC/FljB family flagellin [Oleiagrimonas sp.]